MPGQTKRSVIRRCVARFPGCEGGMELVENKTAERRRNVWAWQCSGHIAENGASGKW